MNKDQRKQLKEAIELLEQAKGKINDAKSIIEMIGEEEQDKFDNLNEGMQAMESGQKLEEAASNLSDKSSECDDLESNIDDIISGVEETIDA